MISRQPVATDVKRWTVVILISMHDESLYAERVLRAGGRGYIMKQEGGKKLMQAIRQVLSGQIYVSEKMSAKILEIFSGRRADAGGSPVEKLTGREFEVFQLIGQGKGTKEIAAQLCLSAKTVEVHRLNIKQKLNQYYEYSSSSPSAETARAVHPPVFSRGRL